MLQLLHRPAESDDAFALFATAATLADALGELALPVDLNPHHGDLVRVVGGRTDRLYVFDAARSSFVEVPRPRGAAPWFERWDGNGADAEDMLRKCGRVDRRRLVLAACDCAETALQYVPAGEERPRVAIETARRWVHGEVGVEDVRVAEDAAWRAADDAWYDSAQDDDDAANAAIAARAAARAAAVVYCATIIAARATAVATDAAWLLVRVSSLRSMAPLVRRHILLSVLACSIVGAADPLRIETC